MMSGKPFRSAAPWFVAPAALLVLVALVRPIDHDESQYVAAAVLAAHGLPYRDFAYLQTPLQPMLFAPVAALAGWLAYPVLRIVNALLGAVALAATWRAARTAGASERSAMIATGLFAATDIFLFGISVARNDALPAALMALALAPIIRGVQGRGTRCEAVLIGLLLAAAAAAKISYALPAAAVGGYALVDRRLRPGWILLGALPPVLLVGWTWVEAPAAFWFGVLTFPARAPAEYYLTGGQAWKLSLAAKAVDTLKFLALGAALPAILLVTRDGGAGRWRVLGLMILAAFVAALLPEPTWRQYLLPVLPPLFVLAALALDRAALGAAGRVTAIVFAIAGLAPSIVALADGVIAGVPVAAAIVQGRAIGRALDEAGFHGTIATLSPQWLPATGRGPDPRFAAGPFYFRSHGLLDPARERAFHLVGTGMIDAQFAQSPPQAIMTGGESRATSGNPGLDRALGDWALRHGWRRAAGAGPLTVYLPPRQGFQEFGIQAARRARPSTSP